MNDHVFRLSKCYFLQFLKPKRVYLTSFSEFMQIILLVGAKLQVIITKMGIRILERGDIVKGAPLVQVGDDLFWFNSPGLILFLIHFVLFEVFFYLNEQIN